LGFSHFLPQVDECVAHPPQGGIDADIGLFSNLLETHVHVMAHNEHLLLFGRQLFNKNAKAYLGLMGDL
jgi:hypothetical protein